MLSTTTALLCTLAGLVSTALILLINAHFADKRRVEVFASVRSAILRSTLPSAPRLTLAQFVDAHVPSLKEGFKSVWWLPFGDAQTIYCSVGSFDDVDVVKYQRCVAILSYTLRVSGIFVVGNSSKSRMAAYSHSTSSRLSKAKTQNPIHPANRSCS